MKKLDDYGIGIYKYVEKILGVISSPGLIPRGLQWACRLRPFRRYRLEVSGHNKSSVSVQFTLVG
jgi:hypothetical protein